MKMELSLYCSSLIFFNGEVVFLGSVCVCVCVCVGGGGG